jgi:selenocysteine lyase/cysteine desulfurase
MTARGLEAVVRASPHYFVSPEDLERAVEAVAAVSGAG